MLGREEHLERTVVFLVQAETLAVPDSAAAELLGKAAEAGREEARAEAALSAAADFTEAARKVGLSRLTPSPIHQKGMKKI